MFDSPCSARHAGTRHSPRFDSLEGRITLSGDGSPGDTPPSALLESTTVDVGPQTEQGPLSVGLIDPAPNSVLTASPTSLLLEFNRPIFPTPWTMMSWSSRQTPTATRPHTRALIR